MNYKGLPIFQATIPDDADGMVICSLVENAAVESNFLAFDEDAKPMTFSIENEEQRMVLGVAMKANYPIYRYHPEFGEFFLVYSPETIQKMVERFFNEHYVNSVDLEHSFELEEGVHLIQAFIKNEKAGISPVGFEDCKDGSLFFQYHIENDEIWNAIKEGTYKGFSIAGTFGLEETFTKQETNNNNTNKEHKLMSKLEKIKQVLRSLLVEFGTVATDKGTLVFDGDELEAGMAVHGIDEEGNEVQLEDGDYRTEDGKIIVVADGKVAEIKDNEAEVAPENEEPANEEPQANEDENPSNEEPANEEPANEEPSNDEKDALIEELKAKVAELEAENAELKAKVEELSNESAAPSAEEAFEKIENPKVETKADKLRQKGYKF